MDAIAATTPAEPSPLLKPVAASAADQHAGPLPLPKMRFGFAMAAIYLALEIAQLVKDSTTIEKSSNLSVLFGLVGAIYWQFCIYRIHKVLRQFTNGSYPIRPGRAVLLGLIPVFNIYWLFHWTNELTRFVNSRCGTNPLRKRSLALWLLLASLIRPLDGGIALYLVGARMSRKVNLAMARTCAEHVMVARRERLNLAISAGLGAGFGYLLYESAMAFLRDDSVEQIHHVIAIVVVSVGVMKFVEPLCERLRTGLGVANPNHGGVRRDLPWAFRFGLLLMLVFTSVSHGLLHSLVEKNPWEAIAVLLATLVISGGTTYAWLSAPRETPAHAGRYGLASSAVLGFLVFLALWVAKDTPSIERKTPQCAQAGPGTVSDSSSSRLGFEGPGTQPNNSAHARRAIEIASVGPAFIFWRVGTDLLARSDVSNVELKLATLTIPWAVLGWVGGLVIDRSRRRRLTYVVSISMLAAVLVTFVLMHLLGAELIQKPQLYANVFAALGWCVALIVYPRADELLKCTPNNNRPGLWQWLRHRRAARTTPRPPQGATV